MAHCFKLAKQMKAEAAASGSLVISERTPKVAVTLRPQK